MAIYFPELFCNVGQKLTVIKDIVFENLTIRSGEQCTVIDIIEYGFDIITGQGTEFRMMNSEMPEYFEKADDTEYNENDTMNTAEEPAVYYNVKQNDNYRNIMANYNLLTFVQKFEIKDVVEIKKGEKFLFTEDNGYTNLHDVNSYRKVLRMNAKEIQQYCQLPN